MLQINIVVRYNVKAVGYGEPWEVHNAPDGQESELIESFEREIDAKHYAQAVLNDCVESAERKAGWSR